MIERHPAHKKFIKSLPMSAQQMLAALVTRRQPLITRLGAERNRLALAHALTRKSIEMIIEALTAELVRIDRDTSDYVQVHFADLSSLLRSVKGVGNVTVATWMGEVSERGRLSRREISALIGVVPIHRDAGILRGKRTIFGGRGSGKTEESCAGRLYAQVADPSQRPG